MIWTEPLPKETECRGLIIPVYLDSETLKYLRYDPALCEQANWLVHIGKAVNKTKEYDETKALEKLITKLKMTLGAYESLSAGNQYRIDEFEGRTVLKKMIENSIACTEKPLPNKHHLENLYWTFSTIGDKDWRKLKREYEPTDFQIFMAAVVRLVEGETDKEITQLVNRVTKAYQRYIVGQKA
jgi:hypothetical protein